MPYARWKRWIPCKSGFGAIRVESGSRTAGGRRLLSGPHMSVTKHAGPSCQPEKSGGKGTPYLGRLLAGPRCGEGAQARAAGLRGGKGSWASGCWANRPRGEGVGLRGEGGVLSFLFILSFSILVSKAFFWREFLMQLNSNQKSTTQNWIYSSMNADQVAMSYN